MAITSKFHFFLRSPQPPRTATAAFDEVSAFGPYTDAGIAKFSGFTIVDILDIDPEDKKARAVCDGLLQVIGPFDPLAITAMLQLRPSITASQDLKAIMGNLVEIPRDFLYDNIDMNSLEQIVTPLISTAPNPENIPLPDCIELFKQGQYGVMVHGGDVIGKASEQGSNPGKSRMGFSITTGERTRLDPATFYELLSSYTGTGAPVIAPADQANNLLRGGVMTTRVLLDVRNEYNAPYSGQITVSDGAANTFGAVILAGYQGFLEVPGGWSQYRISLAGRKQTSIPAGDNAYDEVPRHLSAPAQWSIQTINLDDWFAVQEPFPTDAALRLPRWTGFNEVTFLIDGIEAYRMMIDAMATVNSASHFIHIAAWWLSQELELIPGVPRTTMLDIARRCKAMNAEFRVLEWGVNAALSLGPLSPLGKESIMGSVHYLVDERTRSYPLGSHHQKLIVVRGALGTIAFCGGIDIKNNRLETPDHNGPHFYHDVHLQVEGPAVRDLAMTFRQRYNELTSLSLGAAADQIPLGDPPLTSTVGSHFVQVARTYPSRVGYVFAPNGERSIRASLLRAIGRAQCYIYIEDQYLVSMDISSAILSVLPSIQRVIIVTNAQTDLPQNQYRRREFLSPLISAAPDKVHAFTLRKGNRPIYCHAKVMIIDDIFASIGSANINRRGLTHDSEVNVFIIDGIVQDGARKFAKNLRITLWSEHLGIRGVSSRATLANPTSAATLALWTRSSPSNRAVRYDMNANIESIHSDTAWNLTHDPDGS